MNDIVKTTSGRILVFAMGLILAGGGAAMLMGPEGLTYVLAGVWPTAIAFAIVAVAMSSYEDHKLAIGAVLGAPWFLWVYAMALTVAVKMPALMPIAYVLLGLGFGALVRAAVPATKEQPVAAPSAKVA